MFKEDCSSESGLRIPHRSKTWNLKLNQEFL